MRIGNKAIFAVVPRQNQRLFVTVETSKWEHHIDDPIVQFNFRTGNIFLPPLCVHASSVYNSNVTHLTPTSISVNPISSYFRMQRDSYIYKWYFPFSKLPKNISRWTVLLLENHNQPNTTNPYDIHKLYFAVREWHRRITRV